MRRIFLDCSDRRLRRGAIARAVVAVADHGTRRPGLQSQGIREYHPGFEPAANGRRISGGRR